MIEKCRYFVESECRKYKISTPQVFYKEMKNDGLYWNEKMYIKTGLNKQYANDSILHELAHHIDFTTNRREWRTVKIKKGGVKMLYHDEHFFEILWELATDFYGNPKKYTWDVELLLIKKMYQKRVNRLKV